MKPPVDIYLLASHQSHPAGVRGLKLQVLKRDTQRLQSHPAGVRGLKLQLVKARIGITTSHPAGVRGLKHNEFA